MKVKKWKVKVKSLSCVQLLVTPWTAAYQAPSSMKVHTWMQFLILSRLNIPFGFWYPQMLKSLVYNTAWCLHVTYAHPLSYLNSSLLVIPPLDDLWHTATAESLQSCPTLFDPIDGSPPGFPVPGILQARTLEWVAISFSNAWKWKWSRLVVSDSSDPMQPTRLLRPWDFPGKSTGVGVPLPSPKFHGGRALLGKKVSKSLLEEW